jgi:phage gp45-like
VLNKSDQPQQCQLPVEVATSSTVTVSAKNKDLTALETAMTTIFGNYDLLKENIYPYLSQG